MNPFASRQFCRRPKGIYLALALLILGEFFGPERLEAHPHVFIEQHLALVFDNRGLSGIHVNWQFDDMFAAMIAADHDKNKNQILEPEEISDIKANAFAYIAHYHYFFTVGIDGRPFQVNQVTDFHATLDNGRLFYEFFIPCEVAADQKPRHIKVAAYDPEYYTAIRFSEKEPWELVNAEAFAIRTDVREDKETLIYFDMVNPWTLFLEFKPK